MHELDGYLTILDILESGEVSYRAEVFYEDREDSFGYPPFDHVGPIRELDETLSGETGPVEILYLLASAPTLGVLAGIIRTWLMRNKGRKVHIAWEDGKPKVEVTGDLSVEEIERLLRAAYGSDHPDIRNEGSTDEEAP